MWEEHVACMKVMTSNKFLNGKPVTKTPLWRPSHRWHNMINVDIKKVECGGMEQMKLAQDGYCDHDN